MVISVRQETTTALREFQGSREREPRRGTVYTLSYQNESPGGLEQQEVPGQSSRDETARETGIQSLLRVPASIQLSILQGTHVRKEQGPAKQR